EALLDTYHDERSVAADDNLLNSTRATDFISPKNEASLLYRNAVLDLARTEPFARALVNSGRLSTPTPYVDSSLNTPDTDSFDGAMRPGTNCTDAPLERDGERCWLLDELGDGFVVLFSGAAPGCDAASLAVGEVAPRLLAIASGHESAQGPAHEPRHEP